MKKFIIIAILFISNSAFASSAWDIGNIDVFEKPAAPTLPAAGGTYVDPTFGTTILRVTDRAHGNEINHEYSYYSAFNADNTRLRLRSDTLGLSLYSFDTVNFTSARIGAFWNGISFNSTSIDWSNLSADVVFGVETGTQKLDDYDPDSGVYTLIKDFDTLVPAGTLNFMTVSADDRWFSFIVGVADSNAGIMVAYDKQTDTVYQHDFSASHSLTDIHSATIDKTGAKVWLNKSGNTKKYVWDIVADTVVELEFDATDRAHGHRCTGTGTIYHVDNWSSGSIIKRDPIDNTSWTHIFEYPSGEDFTQEFHYSLNHDDESYLYFSSDFATPATATEPYQDEIIKCWTDASLQHTRRLAHHRTEWAVYNDYPMACSDRTGKYVMFKSNWDGSIYVDVFIILVAPLNSSSPSSFTGTIK